MKGGKQRKRKRKRKRKREKKIKKIRDKGLRKMRMGWRLRECQ